MMQQEEGFASEERVELVDYSYHPVYQHTIVQRGREVEKSRFVNEALREACLKEVVARERDNIVFNNCSHQIGCKQNAVQFSANFESGNLEVVIRRKYLHYQLYMSPDSNTNSHFQWFYFRAKAAKGRKTVHLTIRNFIKSSMLYSKGLKPFFRTAPNAPYRQIPTQAHFYQDQQQNHNLSFTYHFEADNQIVELCSQPPYANTQLQSLLREIKTQKRSLCLTTMGRKVPYFVINQHPLSKVIGLAIARQHPGESVGSWVMEGFIRKLQDIGASRPIQWVVVPMLNMDGVALGNNRTGVLGHDFNRNWNVDQLQKKKKILPENWGLLCLIKQIRKRHPRKLKIFLDFHGHSSQPNVFTYGPPHDPNSEKYYASRMFPEMLARLNSDFRLQQCSYTINPDKKETARSLAFHHFGVPFAYTIESSFGIMSGRTVGVEQFLAIGRDVAEAVNEFAGTYLLREKGSEQASMFLEQVKAKYQDLKTSVEEFQSASEESLDCPVVRAFEIKVEDMLMDKKMSFERVNLSMKSHFRPEGDDTRKADLTLNHRYDKPRRGRVETEGSIQEKAGFLPRLQEHFRSRPNLKSVELKEESPPSLMSIKEIQKRLFRLRNSRIGKKILIINAYGV